MKKTEAEEDKRQFEISSVRLNSDRRRAHRFSLQLKNLKGMI